MKTFKVKITEAYTREKLILSDAQKHYMNDLWDGDELCPNCGYETPFESFNPMETDFIECKDCGKKIRPCNLCDSALCGVYETCQESILASLLHYNDEWNEEINGKYPGE